MGGSYFPYPGAAAGVLNVDVGIAIRCVVPDLNFVLYDILKKSLHPGRDDIPAVLGKQARDEVLPKCLLHLGLLPLPLDRRHEALRRIRDLDDIPIEVDDIADGCGNHGLPAGEVLKSLRR
jgi:hypothetical protein